MSFSFFSHTADIGISVRAASLDDLFADAAIALTETITDHRLVAADRSTPVCLRSTALDLLLVDWLNDLVYRFDTEGFLASSARVAVTRDGSDWVVAGSIEGEIFESARHPIKLLVKAATYHALQVRETPDGWQATVVVDV